ncbi:MAG: LamG domain-containing protein [SAR202 cluster bacterium]|jgi:hypothetical protein|nr:hypothetical protein [Chloroflexota bacterium]MDP6421873.1 hypothetical protein [SAR202 cluster bacterium]HAL48932.1 hypothetical protein [Dehalococcoidia bacterium]MDP6799320.1 hypothetical protein [SAR202 cluster bacterium]MQG57215.1 LamG domain-containing protein [SAR202 cluster bacterium]|tara:strand:- start:794 stop:2854 length:2061 start_codon:yes stop_codon:yes gene_type:complete
MNREFTKLSLMVMTLVAGVAVIGTGFDIWTGALDVGSTVNTDHVSLEVVEAFTDDDGIVNQAGFDDEDDNTVNVQLFDGWATSSSADPAGTGADPKDHSNKGVGRCSITVVSASTVLVTKENVYPGYNCTTWLDYTNTGSVPVRVRRVTVDGSFPAINVATSSDVLSLDLSGDSVPDTDVALSNIPPCQQIDPGETIRMDIEQSILQKAPQGSSLSYTAEVETAQWNELATSTDAITAAYWAVKTIVGPGTIILPFNGVNVCHIADGSPDQSVFDSDVFTTIGAERDLFTWPEALNLFDTPPSAQGAIPVVSFNGTDEVAISAQDSHYSRDDSIGQGMSIGAWVKRYNASRADMILSKWDESGQAREWRVYGSPASNKLVLSLYDEDADNQVTRISNAGLSTGQWHFVVTTYDGAGGANAMDGALLYADGSLATSTPSYAPGYVGMQGTMGPAVIAAQFSGGNRFTEDVAGGPIGPFFVPRVLSAAEIGPSTKLDELPSVCLSVAICAKPSDTEDCSARYIKAPGPCRPRADDRQSGTGRRLSCARKRVQMLAQLIGQRRVELHVCRAPRVPEAESVGVQEMPPDARVRVPVRAVTDDRVADGCKVDPYLVSPTRLQGYLGQRVPLKRRQSLVHGRRVLPGVDYGHTFAIARVSPHGRLDNSFRRRQHSVDQRRVAFGELACFDLA